MKKIIGLFINSTAHLAPKFNGSFAFKLLCRVQSPPLKEATKIFFKSGNTTFIDTSYKKIALHSWGTGSKHILFVHGWLSNSKQWQPYVKAMDLEKYTVYALDAPSHGLSEGKMLHIELYREAIVAVINHIGNIHCAVCHSLGCLATSYAYLLDQNIPVKSFIIMGSPSGMDAIFNYFKQQLSLSSAAMTNLYHKVHTILKLPSDDIHMEVFFSSVKAPTLVIHEENDQVTPIAPIKKALRQNSTIQKIFTQGQDHMLKDSNTVNKVLAFITKSQKNDYVFETI